MSGTMRLGHLGGGIQLIQEKARRRPCIGILQKIRVGLLEARALIGLHLHQRGRDVWVHIAARRMNARQRVDDFGLPL
jgi:hypothetical protein